MAVSVLFIQGAPMKPLPCDRHFLETADTTMNKNLCWVYDSEEGVETLHIEHGLPSRRGPGMWKTGDVMRGGRKVPPWGSQGRLRSESQ